MAFNVSQFLSQQKLFGLARPNQFDVYLAGVSNGENITSKVYSRLYCKSASIPGVLLNFVEVPYQGHYVSVPTTRYYSDWTVTVINDSKYVLRTILEKWVDAISSKSGVPHRAGIGNLIDNVRSIFSLGRGLSPNAVKLDEVFKDMWVVQYTNAKVPTPMAVYFLREAFPTNISDIELAWDENDSTEDYRVTFRYAYFERKTFADLPGTILNTLGL